MTDPHARQAYPPSSEPAAKQIAQTNQNEQSRFDKIWSNAFIIIAVLAVLGFVAVVILKLAIGSSLKDVTKTLFLPVLAGLGGLIQWLFKKQKEHEQKIEQEQLKQKLELNKLHEAHRQALELNHQKQLGELALQRQQFSSALTIQKKTEIVEEVLATLEDHSFIKPRKGGRIRVMGEIREIRELFYKVLIYFEDPGLLKHFKRAFVACFQGRPDRIVENKHEIIERFRKKLRPSDMLEKLVSTNEMRIEHHLTDLVRSYLGVENGLVPIQVVQRRKKEYNKQLWLWLNLRYSSECSKDDLRELTNKQMTVQDIRKIEAGDVLVFWEDRYGEALDGILGVAWVKKVLGDHFSLGFRETVAPNAIIGFDRIQKIAHQEQHTFDNQETPRVIQASQEQGFEDAIRGRMRIPKDKLKYMVLDGLGRTLELLTQKHPRIDLERFSCGGRIALYRNKDINLYIDADEYMASQGKEMVNWLYHFSNWVSQEEVVFYFRGAEHKVTQFKPITDHKGDHGTGQDPFADRTFKSREHNPLLDLRLFTPEYRALYQTYLRESFSCIRLVVDEQYAEKKDEKQQFYQGIDPKKTYDVTIRFISNQTPYAMELAEKEESTAVSV